MLTHTSKHMGVLVQMLHYIFYNTHRWLSLCSTISTMHSLVTTTALNLGTYNLVWSLKQEYNVIIALIMLCTLEDTLVQSDAIQSNCSAIKLTVVLQYHIFLFLVPPCSHHDQRHFIFGWIGFLIHTNFMGQFLQRTHGLRQFWWSKIGPSQSTYLTITKDC